MNKHDAHDYIPLLQALGDGEIIQFKNVIDNRWEDLESVDFGYSAKYYRVKPEPRTFVIACRKSDGLIRNSLGKFVAKDWEFITVQEVL